MMAVDAKLQHPDEAHDANWNQALQSQIDLLTSIEQEFVPLPWGHDHACYLEQHPRSDLGPPVAMEVCSGSARLTRTFIKAGVKAFGIDNKRNVHKPMGPTLTLDLSEPCQEQLLWQWFEQHHVIFNHMAPPCGTASRARETIAATSSWE